MSTGEHGTGDVTQLLSLWGRGDKRALDRLISILYAELRRLAAGYLKRELPGHTLQPTGLVHEAYIRLVRQTSVDCQGRAQFFGIAANLMRQILVNHARRRNASKRSSGQTMLVLGQAPDPSGGSTVDLLALDRALNRLAELDARQSEIVEMRFFGGLTEEEIALALGVSSRTVKREWQVAKLMLHHEMHGGRPA